ncbi:WD-40 repeat protein [Reticulomyxa filosa]|uniref:WD-40 repeat protein n=1 Tax=Reticulomyxa filosa TaxID=46433 RepID=X6LWG8_RETFI|nr:WD-40 repeat protein [Reticulomyxa filosa]|eukprot:ETO06278.1 WD-40 repeat protein [Reticulomyxa filosa]
MSNCKFSEDIPHWICVTEFSPDGQTIVSYSWDATIRLWDIKSGLELMKLKGYTEIDHTIRLWDVNTGKDVQRTKCHSNASFCDSRISLWDVSTCEKLKELKGYSNPVRCARFLPEGQFIVSCSNDKTVRLLDVESRKEVKRLEGYPSTVKEVKYFPDSKSGDEIQTLDGHFQWIAGVDVSPDGNTVVSYSYDKKF